MTDTLIEIDELIAKSIPVKVECGIYFLLSDGIVVYVGQSVIAFYRVANHLLIKVKKFDSYAFVACAKESLKIMEDLYIEKYKPIYNYQHMPKFLKDSRARDRKQESEALGVKGIDLWSAKECAEQIGVSLRTLERWRGENRGPKHMRLGGQIRYAPSDVESWFTQTRVAF